MYGRISVINTMPRKMDETRLSSGLSGAYWDRTLDAGVYGWGVVLGSMKEESRNAPQRNFVKGPMVFIGCHLIYLKGYLLSALWTMRW